MKIFNKSLFSVETNSTKKAALILALIIITAFSPIIFLNQSYNGGFPVPIEQLGYDGKYINRNTTLDTAAGYAAIRPMMKFATELMKEGIIPLWNPHMGTGNPLAADTINYIFSPTIPLFLTPFEFWDFGLLTQLWLAGFFMFLFLRTLKLNFASSIAGSTFYMLSGAFVWFLPHTHIPVMVFTPFILYSLERLIQTREPKFVVLTSIAFCFGILGAHLESIILQLTLVGAYFGYRVLGPLIQNYYLKYKNKTQRDTIKQRTINLKKVLGWSIVAFIGGIGLSSFFILPVYELTSLSSLPHSTGFGLHSYQFFAFAFPFIPDTTGTLQTYLIPEFRDVHRYGTVFGFIGLFSLFFAVLSIFRTIKYKVNNDVHKYTALFFLGFSVFFLLKIYPIPIINSFGELPFFNMIAFGRYVGVVIPIGFAVAAAFGIDWLCKIKVKMNIIALVFLITISVVLLLSIPLFGFLLDESNISTQKNRDLAISWVSYQYIQTILFAAMAFLVSIAASRNKSAISALVFLIILELSLYIPMGLDFNFTFDKSVITLIGMALITVLVLKQNRLSWNLKLTEKKVKLSVISAILIATAVGWIVVSDQSPSGIGNRFNQYQENPLTIFLKENIEDHRMLSFNYRMGPNFPTGYKIDSLAILTPFISNWFATFNVNFLNPAPNNSNLGWLNFESQYGKETSNLYLSKKQYYDFLGVKYLIASNRVNPNHYLVSYHEKDNATIIYLKKNFLEQEFTSPIKQINSFNIVLGNFNQSNSGQVVLTLDSIPQNNAYHREVVVNAEEIETGYQNFQFTPIADVKDIKLKIGLKYMSSNPDDSIAAVVNNDPKNFYSDRIQGNLMVDQLPHEGILVFSIGSELFPVENLGRLTLYENPGAFPRVFLVDKFQTAGSFYKAQNIIKNSDFDLRKEIVIERTLSDPKPKLAPLSPESQASIISYTPNEVTINVKTTTPAFLVLTDSFYPGWHAYVDGEETKIYRTNGLVRSIFVPSGDHTVKFSYMPESFVNGVTISLITAGLLLGFLVFSRWKMPSNDKNFAKNVNT